LPIRFESLKNLVQIVAMGRAVGVAVKQMETAGLGIRPIRSYLQRNQTLDQGLGGGLPSERQMPRKLG